MLPGVARVVVPSERLLRVATERWRLPAGRVRLIPNGIRTDAFAPADRNPGLRRRLGIPEAAPLVGAVGSLRPVKNLPRLLDALAAIARFTRRPRHAASICCWSATGRTGQRSSGGRPSWGSATACASPATRRTSPRGSRAMDVFALSSDTEQIPVALLEAMAAGLPVAATDVGDVRAVLPPEQEGFVVPVAGAATVRGLARRIEALLRDPALARRLGRANRRRVEERYGFERMCADYREVYEEALTVGGR